MRTYILLLISFVLLGAMMLVLWSGPEAEESGRERVQAPVGVAAQEVPPGGRMESATAPSLSRENLQPESRFGWTGRATFADGRPAQGMEVMVLDPGRSRWAKNYQVTDGDGRYFIDGTPWAHLHEETEPPSVYLRKASAKNNRVPALPSDPPAVVDFEIAGDTQVRVWVIAEQTGKGIPEAPLRASNQKVSMEVEAVTNDAGYADFLLPAGTQWEFRSTVAGVGTGYFTSLQVGEDASEIHLILDAFPARIRLMARDASTGAALEHATYHSLHHDPQVLEACVYELAALPRVLPVKDGVMDVSIAHPNPAWILVEAQGYRPVQVSVSGHHEETLPVLMTPLRPQGIRISEHEKPTSGEIMLRYRPSFQAVGRHGHRIWRDPKPRVFAVDDSGFVEVWIPDKESQPEIFLSAKTKSGLRRYWRGLKVADFPASEWRIPLFAQTQVRVTAAAASSQSRGGRLPALHCELTLDPAARSSFDRESDYRYVVDLHPYTRDTATAFVAAPSTLRIRTTALSTETVTAHLVPGEVQVVEFPY